MPAVTLINIHLSSDDISSCIYHSILLLYLCISLQIERSGLQFHAIFFFILCLPVLPTLQQKIQMLEKQVAEAQEELVSEKQKFDSERENEVAKLNAEKSRIKEMEKQDR